jgi:hypothetical protein
MGELNYLWVFAAFLPRSPELQPVFSDDRLSISASTMIV